MPRKGIFHLGNQHTALSFSIWKEEGKWRSGATEYINLMWLILPDCSITECYYNPKKWEIQFQSYHILQRFIKLAFFMHWNRYLCSQKSHSKASTRMTSWECGIYGKQNEKRKETRGHVFLSWTSVPDSNSVRSVMSKLHMTATLFGSGKVKPIWNNLFMTQFIYEPREECQLVTCLEDTRSKALRQKHALSWQSSPSASQNKHSQPPCSTPQADEGDAAMMGDGFKASVHQRSLWARQMWHWRLEEPYISLVEHWSTSKAPEFHCHSSPDSAWASSGLTHLVMHEGTAKLVKDAFLRDVYPLWPL